MGLFASALNHQTTPQCSSPSASSLSRATHTRPSPNIPPSSPDNHFPTSPFPPLRRRLLSSNGVTVPWSKSFLVPITSMFSRSSIWQNWGFQLDFGDFEFGNSLWSLISSSI